MHGVGAVIRKSAKQGGGMYVVTGIVNCARASCAALCEEREYIEPTKRHIKNGKYHTHVVWCEQCGFSEYSGREVILKVKYE